MVTGKDITLNRMWPLLKRAGNPQQRLRVVHIAGTSGKTSTAYYTAALLRVSGFGKIGLTVSPHILSISERLQINGTQLEERQFCELFDRFHHILPQGTDATYFEYMIVFILWAFDELGVDYVVMETGLGGLYDATNVCQRADKICVITDIGLDHQQVLGYSIAEIATQKAGIIHEDNQVFMMNQSEQIMQVFIEHSRIVHATLHTIGDNPRVIEKNLPQFQNRNWLLAKNVVSYMCETSGLSLPIEEVLNETRFTVIGRMQKIVKQSTTFIIDGAHNEQKMGALISSLIAEYPHFRTPVILSMKEGKEYVQVLKLLKPITKKLICVNYKVSQDTQIQSIDSQVLHDAATKLGIPSQSMASVEDSIRLLIKEKEPVVLVTGSLYMMKSLLSLLESDI